MFRTISITGFVAVFAVIVLHFIVSRPKADNVFGKDRRLRILDVLRYPVFLLTLLFVEQKWNLVGALRKLVFLLALLCFAVLAVTGFVPPLILGKAISGWWLVIHATFAPVFAACVAILAVMWADNSRFDKNYWPWLNRVLRRLPQSTTAVEKYELGRKICFWLILFLALPVMLSEVLSMLPLFGTDGQELLLGLHRYSTLSLALFSIAWLYLTSMAEMQKNAVG